MSNEHTTSPIEGMDAAIGRRVREIMWDRRITSKTLALAIGVDPTGLGRRLRGERGWSADETMAAARYLGVTVGVLFCEDSLPNGWAPSGSNRRPKDYRGVGRDWGSGPNELPDPEDSPPAVADLDVERERLRPKAGVSA